MALPIKTLGVHITSWFFTFIMACSDTSQVFSLFESALPTLPILILQNSKLFLFFFFFAPSPLPNSSLHASVIGSVHTCHVPTPLIAVHSLLHTLFLRYDYSHGTDNLQQGLQCQRNSRRSQKHGCSSPLPWYLGYRAGVLQRVAGGETWR